VIYPSEGQKGEISLQSSKRNLGPKINMVVRYINRSAILNEARKYILLGVEKVKISLQSPKTKFEL
jgi:hypothetical protein